MRWLSWLLLGTLNLEATLTENVERWASPSRPRPSKELRAPKTRFEVSNPAEGGSNGSSALSLAKLPPPRPPPRCARQKGVWSLQLVTRRRETFAEEAANEFGLYSFQNLMFCDDDISVATEGLGRQVCAAAPALRSCRQRGQCSRRCGSAPHLHSLFCLIDQRGCRGDQLCSPITGRCPDDKAQVRG